MLQKFPLKGKQGDQKCVPNSEGNATAPESTPWKVVPLQRAASWCRLHLNCSLSLCTARLCCLEPQYRVQNSLLILSSLDNLHTQLLLLFPSGKYFKVLLHSGKLCVLKNVSGSLHSAQDGNPRGAPRTPEHSYCPLILKFLFTFQ